MCCWCSNDAIKAWLMGVEMTGMLVLVRSVDTAAEDDDDDDDAGGADDDIGVTSFVISSPDTDATTVVSAIATTCRVHCSNASRAGVARRQRMSEKRMETGMGVVD